jgi:arylsulfatase A-like enzyme
MAGYKSALAGVQHIADSTVKGQGSEAIGYDELLESRERSSESFALSACTYLRREHDRPFFLSVGFPDTHRSFGEPGPGDDSLYSLPPAPLPDTEAVRRDMAAFKTSARRYDDAVGHVLRTLREEGLEENTLVINTTDHGIPFPHMKCNLTDHGTGVMLIMRGPGGFAGGKVVDGMVSQIDIFPTICELLDIEAPERLQGRSFMSLVSGERDEVNDEVFSEVTYHAAYEPKRAVRTTRWKYIRRFDGRTRGVMPNCDDGLSKQELLKYGFRERPVAGEQLYDLVFDPNEACNVAGSAEHADVLQDMRARLEAWMERTDDPLLKGDVPLPDGGVTTGVDELNPTDKLYDHKGRVVDRAD